MTYKLEKIRALIIDDNMPIRMLVRSLMLDLGFGHVDVAANGEDGWAMYVLHKPDLILLDWRMEGMDGFEFTRRVRTERASPKPKIPIIMMSGFTSKKMVLAARDIGVTEVMIKPFTIETLVRHLSHIVENPRDFVVAPKFVGPDRRRRKEDPKDQKKRKVDPKEEPPQIKKDSKYLDLRGGVYDPDKGDTK